MPEVNTKKGAGKQRNAPGKAAKPADKKTRTEAEAPAAERAVLYPVVRTDESTRIDVEKVRVLLGLEEETEHVKFGSSFLFKDRFGRKIRCRHNVKNRPFYMSDAERLVQEILNKRWRLNGETVIIGKTGLVENGQHTLVAVYLAEQDRVGGFKHANPGLWEENWPAPVYVDKIIVYGIEEDDETINTMDTCKPRSLADVIYRSGLFGKKFAPKQRRETSRMTDYAVRVLWQRTGAKDDPFAPRRTHTEAMEFIARHPRIIQAVKHIYEENKVRVIGKGKDAKKIRPVSRFLNPGVAAALLYLMGCSRTEEGVYRDKMGVGFEKGLDWDEWEKAKHFWVQFAADTSDFQEVRYALAGLVDEDSGGAGKLSERIGTIAKAWNLYRNEYEFSQEGLRIRFIEDQDGIRSFIEDESSTFLGIDQGCGEKTREEDREQTDDRASPGDDGGEAAGTGKKVGKKMDAQRREDMKRRLLENRKEREDSGKGNGKGRKPDRGAKRRKAREDAERAAAGDDEDRAGLNQGVVNEEE